MNLFKYFKTEIDVALAQLVADGVLPQGIDTAKVTAEPPREESHGDVATNAAMVLSKAAGKKPRDIADSLAVELRKHPAVTAVEVAGPGFINLRLAESFWYERLAEILVAGAAWGDGERTGRRVNVEYVSANPTGPMHVGHARGAVVGDALASLLAKSGVDVTREYYINDAGAQVDVLAHSLRGRYLVEMGKITQADFERMREEGVVQYGGDYVRDCALALIDRDGGRWADAEEAEWLAPFRDFAIDYMMGMIREDLVALGVKHDVFTSERALVRSGKVDDALKFLEERDEVYTGVLEPPKGKTPDDWEPRPQVLFRATRFGDDVDRPLKKSDGSFTYFASDIAYHQDKYLRGFADMIDIWGADHGGYVKRMQAAVKAISEGGGGLDVRLCQMVNLLKGGQPYKMRHLDRSRLKLVRSPGHLIHQFGDFEVEIPHQRLDAGGPGITGSLFGVMLCLQTKAFAGIVAEDLQRTRHVTQLVAPVGATDINRHIAIGQAAHGAGQAAQLTRQAAGIEGGKPDQNQCQPPGPKGVAQHRRPKFGIQIVDINARSDHPTPFRHELHIGQLFHRLGAARARPVIGQQPGLCRPGCRVDHLVKDQIAGRVLEIAHILAVQPRLDRMHHHPVVQVVDPDIFTIIEAHRLQRPERLCLGLINGGGGRAFHFGHNDGCGRIDGGADQPLAILQHLSALVEGANHREGQETDGGQPDHRGEPEGDGRVPDARQRERHDMCLPDLDDRPRGRAGPSFCEDNRSMSAPCGPGRDIPAAGPRPAAARLGLAP